jgi:hypothetical protein
VPDPLSPYIRIARATQHAAARASRLHGLCHPLTCRALALAARAAAWAWEAGHHVSDLHSHPLPRVSGRAYSPEPVSQPAEPNGTDHGFLL